MTIRDKGIFLISYYYGDYLKNIRIHFRSHSHNNGTGTIAAQELQKIVYSRLFSSSKILSTKPDKLEFYYSYGTKKKVPVRWSGRVIPEELYFISRVEYSPDSVTIYASEEKLDSINMVYTEQLNYANFRDTLSVYCRLSKIKSVKMVPDHVQVNFFTDVLTEERIEGIPVQGINMPEGKTLRTFPAKVAVNFVTGVNVYRNLRPQDFTVVVDYNDIKKNLSEKCDIHLKNVPSGISRARLETTQVDYLIESQE
jgi:YbbR domain-containing protein